MALDMISLPIVLLFILPSKLSQFKDASCFAVIVSGILLAIAVCLQREFRACVLSFY